MRRLSALCSPVRIWLTAVRPFAYTASVLTVALGVAMAHHAGYALRWGALALTLLGVVCFHTAANLLNDCFDHRRGLDRQVLPASGAVVRGWITERQAFRAAMLCLALGVLCGVALFAFAGWVVAVLGILGAICALGYTTPRFCFKYAGLGDLAIFIAFGILPVFGTWWVQTRTFAWLPILWSIPLASLAVGILHANNWRDLNTDAERGCRTAAGWLGFDGSRQYYRLLVLSPFALVALYVGLGRMSGANLSPPPLALIVFLALPLALRLARIRPAEDQKTFAMLVGRTAQLHMIFGALCAAAFWISPHLQENGEDKAGLAFGLLAFVVLRGDAFSRTASINAFYWSNSVSPSRTAYFVSSAMLKTFSFCMMLRRWVSTVLTLTKSLAAVSLVEFPSASSCSTSRSRPESRR